MQRHLKTLAHALANNATKAVLAAALAAMAGAHGVAQAQDYDAMIQQSMRRMDQIIQQGQQQVHMVVQQRMHDPAVQAAWHRYVQQSGGRPAMSYYQFTYQYIYTNGFSAQGVAHARATEAGIQAREQAAWQGYRQAQASRAQAQQAQRDSFYANQQEAGRVLMGQSTYVTPQGHGLVLPHTWQRNTTHRWQGNTYHVDASGQYHALASNGWWVPLTPGH